MDIHIEQTFSAFFSSDKVLILIICCEKNGTASWNNSLRRWQGLGIADNDVFCAFCNCRALHSTNFQLKHCNSLSEHTMYIPLVRLFRISEGKNIFSFKSWLYLLFSSLLCHKRYHSIGNSEIGDFYMFKDY